MLRKLTNGKIVMGICLPKSLKETIDTRRGDIPRSKYISRILERQLASEKERESAEHVKAAIRTKIC
jgi:metal-responsive CopG/Arc/MetJ family transcriptional regulator